jgi:uncharacterized ion transporter superfamily protein YfcC
MPLISGQSYGFIAGIVLTIVYAGVYFVMKYSKRNKEDEHRIEVRRYQSRLSTEFSKELTDYDKKEDCNKIEESNKDNYYKDDCNINKNK